MTISMATAARAWRLVAAILSLIVIAPAFAQEERASRADAKVDANWPRFRGVDGAGISGDSDVPLQWSATNNIVWKADLPGRGASSPIVWGDHVYVTAYSGYGLVKGDPNANVPKLVRHLLCFSSTDGRRLWKADAPIGMNPDHPNVDYLDLHGYASSTPVADASGVYVYYGTCGAIAYSHEGRERWRKQLGEQYYSWGSAASPILFENLLIVHADIEATSLVALDKQTGREVWRIATGDRDSWSTPLVVASGGRRELVYHHSTGEPTATLAAVNPRDGSSLWQCRVLKDYLCPSPIAHGGIIYALAYQKGAAIRPGGRGDVTDSHVLWTANKGSEVCTPLYHDGHLYWTSPDSGIANCLNARTGEMVYQERLEPAAGRIYASGVTADGRIYYVSREAGAYVVAAVPKFELLAHNRIENDDSVFNATPAISQGRLFLRSDKRLYCIGAK
jgi:outer membrane protein assembly factor BamB